MHVSGDSVGRFCALQGGCLLCLCADEGWDGQSIGFHPSPKDLRLANNILHHLSLSPPFFPPLFLCFFGPVLYWFIPSSFQCTLFSTSFSISTCPSSSCCLAFQSSSNLLSPCLTYSHFLFIRLLSVPLSIFITHLSSAHLLPPFFLSQFLSFSVSQCLKTCIPATGIDVEQRQSDTHTRAHAHPKTVCPAYN